MNPNEIIFILAGNTRQAEYWARDHNLQKHQFINWYFPHQVVGTRGCKYVKVGTWYEKSNSWDFDEMILVREMEEISSV